MFTKFHFEGKTSLLIFQREKICSMTSGATSLNMSFIDLVFIAQTLHWRYIRQSGSSYYISACWQTRNTAVWPSIPSSHHRYPHLPASPQRRPRHHVKQHTDVVEEPQNQLEGHPSDCYSHGRLFLPDYSPQSNHNIKSLGYAWIMGDGKHKRCRSQFGPEATKG